MPENNRQFLASDLAGTWCGSLAVGVVSLRTVINLRLDSGGLTATMDSPDQGAFGLPVENVSLASGNKLTVIMPAIGAVYEGDIKTTDRISGAWTQAGQKLSLELERLPGPIDYARPQDPRPPFPYTAVDVSFKNDAAGITLAGTLTYPATDQALTAVILISGSGSQNRNEEIMGHRPFLVLADHLSRRGIAVLRCDDRGVGGSEGDPALATSRDFASDVEAAIAYLKTQRLVKIARIGLAGHSEGGLIAPLVASASPDVAFLVLLAGPGCPGRKILLQQSEAIMRAAGRSEADIEAARRSNNEIYDLVTGPDPIETQKAKIRAILAAAGMTDTAQIEAQISAVTSPWFKFFLSYDPVPVLEKTRLPVLALNGALDLQVPPGPNLGAIERALRKAGNDRFAIKEFPRLNHLFQTAQTGLMDEYARIQETIAPAVLDTIADWIGGLVTSQS